MFGVSNTVLTGPFFRMAVGLAIGFSFIVIGIFPVARVAKLRSHGIETAGRVVALRIVIRKKDQNTFPWVEFTDSNGISHQKEMSPAAVKEGDTVTVLYLPDEPENADIKSARLESPLFGYIMMGLSLIGWVLAGYNGIKLLKTKKQPA